MPKLRKRYYAVRCGREGSKIYEDKDECTQNTRGLRGASQKLFLTREAAEGWLLMGKYGLDSFATDSKKSKPRPKRPRSCNPLPSPEPSSPPQPISPSSIISVSPDSTDTHPASVISISSDSVKAQPKSSISVISISSESSSGTDIRLSEEQERVLEMVKAGQNVFFTGSAGTGKSVLLRAIINWCQTNKLEHAVTASTGIAALNIGGQTIHSWAGIQLGKESAERLVSKVLGRRQSRGRWQTVEMLVIDEISMIDGRLFDKLEYIARVVRQDNRPFGGIQLVISGDFCQLPPVPDRDSQGMDIPPMFAFEAETWEPCVGKPVFLSKVFRQKDEVRRNVEPDALWTIDHSTVRAFKALSRPVAYDDDIEPTELFSTRREVENANAVRLAQLKTRSYTYVSVDTPGHDSYGRPVSAQIMQYLLDKQIAQQCIMLKMGTQVMLIRNLEQGSLVNGSVGKVTGFMTARNADRQGITIGVPESQLQPDDWIISPQRYGDWDPINPLRELALSSPKLYPVVTFSNGRVVLCVPSGFDATNANGEVEAKRRQVPLILAWALSIHKSQGMTLERVQVDLGRVFEKGQAYIALYRATSMDRLEVKNFDPTKVSAHPRVLAWMRISMSAEAWPTQSKSCLLTSSVASRNYLSPAILHRTYQY